MENRKNYIPKERALQVERELRLARLGPFCRSGKGPPLFWGAQIDKSAVYLKLT